MGQGQLAELDGAELLPGGRAGAPAKDAHIQQRVAHQPVAAVDAARRLAGHEQAGDAGVAVGLDGDAAVLVVERGVDEHRVVDNVHAKAPELADHGRQLLLDGARAVEDVDHRRVEPHPLKPGRGLDAVAPLLALADEGRRLDVAGLARKDELVAVDVAHLRAQAAHLLGHQQADDLLGIGGAGGVVLHGVDEGQRRADAVGHHQAVAGGAIVVGAGKAHVVQPAAAAGGDDRLPGADHRVLAGLQVQQHGAGGLALVVQQQLDGRGELDHGDLVGVGADLVAQGAHDLGAGIVARRVHALAAGAAAVDGDHRAVGLLVEHAAQALQPLDDAGRVAHQRLDQVGVVAEVAAADDVQVVLGRRVGLLVGGLDAALGHHGVGVAVAQLGDHQHLGAVLAGQQRRRRPRPAAADDQHVGVVIDLLQVELDCCAAGCALPAGRPARWACVCPCSAPPAARASLPG